MSQLGHGKLVGFLVNQTFKYVELEYISDAMQRAIVTLAAQGLGYMDKKNCN